MESRESDSRGWEVVDSELDIRRELTPTTVSSAAFEVPQHHRGLLFIHTQRLFQQSFGLHEAGDHLALERHGETVLAN